MNLRSKLLSFFAFPILVFLVHLVSVGILNLYVLFPRIDIVFHYVGGLAIAFTSAQILSYLETENIMPTVNRLLFVVMLIALTAMAAVLWEFAEFLSDQLLHTDLQGSIANTMQDQFLGVLGGMTWDLICYKRLTNRSSS